MPSSRRSRRSAKSGKPARTNRTQRGSTQDSGPDSNRRGRHDRDTGPSENGQRAAQRRDDQDTGGKPRPQRERQGNRPHRRNRRRIRTVDETSAGGLVVDVATGRAALIGRTDRRGRLLWSLPKGHIEAGETAEQAAVREVAEETGIAGAILATLGTIDYWFVAEDRRVHKTVHHFLLRAVGGETSDADHEVTEVAWVALHDLQGRLAYADERRLVRRADELLAEAA